jgi:inorganic pyrophosphatase
MTEPNIVDFWKRLDDLVAARPLVIDRPRGSPHPRYPEMVYPLDYGYLKGTSGGDGNELDVWRGSLPEAELVGILCTVDMKKGDAEIKLLLGLAEHEIEAVARFLNNEYMSAIVIRRGNPRERAGLRT